MLLHLSFTYFFMPAFTGATAHVYEDEDGSSMTRTITTTSPLVLVLVIVIGEPSSSS